MPRAVDHASEFDVAASAATSSFTCVPFDFHRLVFAHGWVQLDPFSWHEPTRSLQRVLTVEGHRCHVAIRYRPAGHRGAVLARITPAVSRVVRPALRRQIVRMLRLDEDFTPFHRRCRRDRALRHVAERGWGGMLRAPTAFEDVVKTICTANCHWRNTRTMCAALCALGGGDFPSPDALVRISARRLAARAPVGYRAETILTVARQTAEGTLPLDDWVADGDVERAREALAAIKGLGAYCVNHIMVLLGIYDRVPVDSAVIKHLRNTYHDGAAVTAAKVVERYDSYGEYAFLAYKFGRHPAW